MKVNGNRHCKLCNKPLEKSQKKYCSNQCSFIDRKGSKLKKRVIPLEEAKNRPYTADTKRIILTWYNDGKGMKKEKIAELLDRSPENIELAFL